MRSKIFVALLLITSPFSWAGSQQQKAPQYSAEEITTFAKDVEKYAAAKHARAFIIARVGRPEKDLPKGIRYTHTAIAIYSSITLDNGQTAKGYAIHNLYQTPQNPGRSQLITDYPVDFFWGVNSLKAGIIIPSSVIQQRLIELVSSGKDAKLHNHRYSVIANPFNTKFQNCTEHTLDMLNAAIYQTTDTKRLKANAKAYFQPQRVDTSPLKLMFGSLLMKDVSTKDHQGKVATTTFSTIHSYLDEYQLVEDAVEFYPNKQAITL